MLVGCVSADKSLNHFQGSYNFSNIKHYTTYQRNSKFNDYQNLSHANRNSIEMAIEQALDQRGLDYTDLAQADVIITYHYVGGDMRELSAYNKGVKYCYHCLQKISKQGAKKVLRGSLIVDVLDKKQERTVWRGTYPLAIKLKDNSKEVHEKVATAINYLIAKLPLK